MVDLLSMATLMIGRQRTNYKAGPEFVLFFSLPVFCPPFFFLNNYFHFLKVSPCGIKGPLIHPATALKHVFFRSTFCGVWYVQTLVSLG